MTGYIHRAISSKIEDAYRYYKVIVITGPRQSGKTSLCRHLFPQFRYVNLENISDRVAASSDPVAYIDSLGEQVVIDEVQNVPELLSMIQVRVDENPELRFVLTGSNNFSLLQSVTQSLAGRAAMFNLLPFSLKETGDKLSEKTTNELLWLGSYPGVIANGIPPYLFYQNYYNTYVERDLRRLLNIKNILAFDTFIKLLAARVGSEFNASALAREAGVSSVTINDWLSILAMSYIAFSLRPYHNNISKRLTKMPKVYFYDTGLLCYLLGIEKSGQLDAHPLRGVVFENYAIGELLKGRLNQGYDPDLYFYREHGGREVDALIKTGDGTELFEIKAAKTLRPDFTANMKAIASVISGVCSSTVIYDGENMPPLAVNIRQV